jgi:hypothetical protein
LHTLIQDTLLHFHQYGTCNCRQLKALLNKRKIIKSIPFVIIENRSFPCTTLLCWGKLSVIQKFPLSLFLHLICDSFQGLLLLNKLQRYLLLLDGEGSFYRIPIFITRGKLFAPRVTPWNILTFLPMCRFSNYCPCLMVYKKIFLLFATWMYIYSCARMCLL